MMSKKRYWNMTADELAKATKVFDEADIIDQSRPLTKAERKQWQRVKKKIGRPRLGLGHKRISVSMEKGLVDRITGLAKKRRMPRSKLMAMVLEQALAEAM
jgi:hypothetical protein